MPKSYKHNKDKFFADIARGEGLEYFARIFEEIAKNEEAHTREIFLLLKAYGSTRDNLINAIETEQAECENTFPELEFESIKKGDLDAARIFKQIGKIDNKHMKKFKRLLVMLDNDTVYKREKPIIWKCGICGYEHEGTSPPEKCPACRNLKEYYIPNDIFI